VRWDAAKKKGDLSELTKRSNEDMGELTKALAVAKKSGEAKITKGQILPFARLIRGRS
jgi:hypothetical protein